MHRHLCFHIDDSLGKQRKSNVIRLFLSLKQLMFQMGEKQQVVLHG